MPYRVSTIFGGKDSIHLEAAFEECRLDDADKVQVVDDETGEALMAMGAVRPCEHCHPFAEAS